MKRVLILTYSFPPSSHSNATRPYLLAKKLLEKNWAVDVVSSTFGVKGVPVESIENPRFSITRIKDPLRFIYKGPFRWNRRTQFLANFFSWPDARIWWVLRALVTVGRRERYDSVIGCIVPRSSLLGPLLAKKLSQVWILDYQEPVSVERMGWIKRFPLQILLRPLLRRLEMLALRYCKQAVFSCESCRNEYLSANLIEKGKTAICYHCYDEDMFNDLVNCDTDNFDIVYAGNFTGKRRGDRNPSGFLKALRKFLDAHPEAVAETRFVFYGTWRKEHDGLLDELNLRVNTVLNHRVSYKEYIKIIQSSPVLLLVVSPQHKLHLPGKLVEYFGAKRPVLAFVDTEGEAYRILKETGYEQFTCEMSDSEAGAKAIERLWREWKSGRLSQLSENTEKWSASIQMNQYMELIDKVISKE